MNLRRNIDIRVVNVLPSPQHVYINLNRFSHMNVEDFKTALFSDRRQQLVAGLSLAIQGVTVTEFSGNAYMAMTLEGGFTLSLNKLNRVTTAQVVKDGKPGEQAILHHHGSLVDFWSEFCKENSQKISNEQAVAKLNQELAGKKVATRLQSQYITRYQTVAEFLDYDLA